MLAKLRADTIPPTAVLNAGPAFTNAVNISVNLKFSEPCITPGFRCPNTSQCDVSFGFLSSATSFQCISSIPAPRKSPGTFVSQTGCGSFIDLSQNRPWKRPCLCFAGYGYSVGPRTLFQDCAFCWKWTKAIVVQLAGLRQWSGIDFTFHAGPNHIRT